MAGTSRPSEVTLRRMLQVIDIAQLERQLGDWLHTQSLADESVALDGKTPLCQDRCRAGFSQSGGER